MNPTIGHAGPPVSILAVAAEHTVIGDHTNPHHLGWLSSGQSYIRDVSDAHLRLFPEAMDTDVRWPLYPSNAFLGRNKWLQS